MAFGAGCISEGVRTGRFPGPMRVNLGENLPGLKVPIPGVLSEEVEVAAAVQMLGNNRSTSAPEEQANPSSKYLLNHTTNAHISTGPAPKTLVFSVLIDKRQCPILIKMGEK